MAEWIRGTDINTDQNLRLQYLAGMGVDSILKKQIRDDILQYCKFPSNLFEGSEARMAALRKTMEAPKRRSHP